MLNLTEMNILYTLVNRKAVIVRSNQGTYIVIGEESRKPMLSVDRDTFYKLWSRRYLEYDGEYDYYITHDGREALAKAAQ